MAYLFYFILLCLGIIITFLTIGACKLLFSELFTNKNKKDNLKGDK